MHGVVSMCKSTQPTCRSVNLQCLPEQKLLLDASPAAYGRVIARRRELSDGSRPIESMNYKAVYVPEKGPLVGTLALHAHEPKGLHGSKGPVSAADVHNILQSEVGPGTWFAPTHDLTASGMSA